MVTAIVRVAMALSGIDGQSGDIRITSKPPLGRDVESAIVAFILSAQLSIAIHFESIFQEITKLAALLSFN
jgi:hypothetical protein